MQVKLTQRWGSKQPGETVDVDDETGTWLVRINRGTANGVQGPSQTAAAPGTDGPDPLAGGDATRRRPTGFLKAPPRDNAALPVPGSPVQYNAGVAPASDGPRASGSRGKAEDSGEPATGGPSTRVSGSGLKRTSDS